MSAFETWLSKFPSDTPQNTVKDYFYRHFVDYPDDGVWMEIMDKWLEERDIAVEHVQYDDYEGWFFAFEGDVFVLENNFPEYFK